MEWVIVGYDACGLLNGAHLEVCGKLGALSEGMAVHGFLQNLVWNVINELNGEIDKVLMLLKNPKAKEILSLGTQ
ncbi:hypothetical protein NC652_029155 [Populus alba x Populus x berolinensis]|nr:hypothetical protein NC652_029155 [Populus alba x Populus x berolinensis]